MKEMDGYLQPVTGKHALDGGYQNPVMQEMDVQTGSPGITNNGLILYRTHEPACPVLGTNMSPYGTNNHRDSTRQSALYHEIDESRVHQDEQFPAQVVEPDYDDTEHTERDSNTGLDQNVGEDDASEAVYQTLYKSKFCNCTSKQITIFMGITLTIIIIVLIMTMMFGSSSRIRIGKGPVTMSHCC